MASLCFHHHHAPPLYSASLRPKASPNSPSSYHLCPKLLSAAPTRRRECLLAEYKKSKSGVEIENEREFLERYGLNPDEFLSEPSPKGKAKKRKGEQSNMGEKGRQVVTKERKPPRETHKLLQVLAGKARRKKLLSPKGMDVRPMMEVVKAAAFSIMQAAGGSPAALQPGRWLDLYSGTGSVGIEAISRGCSEIMWHLRSGPYVHTIVDALTELLESKVHFVEMDPWVVSDVLRPNLENTGFLEVSTIHTLRVEDFLKRADQLIGTQGPFNYISVTPPYLLVDYGVLMNQISTSAVIGDESFIVVEYPLNTDMLDSCGPLVKIADRRFGRTHLAIYGPTWAQKKK